MSGKNRIMLMKVVCIVGIVAALCPTNFAGKPPAACKRCPSTTDGGGDVGFYEVLRGVLYKHLDVIRDTICDNAVVVDVAKQKKANKQKKMDENEEEEIAAAAAMERKEKFCTLIGKLSDTINTVLVYKDRADKQQQNALYIEEMNKCMRTFLAEQKADIAQQLGSTRIQDIQGKVDEWMKEQEQKVEEYNAAAVNNGANPDDAGAEAAAQKKAMMEMLGALRAYLKELDNRKQEWLKTTYPTSKWGWKKTAQPATAISIFGVMMDTNVIGRAEMLALVYEFKLVMEKLELLEKQLQQKACPLPEQPPQPQQRQKRRTKRNVYPLENAYTDTFNDEIGAMEFMRNFMEVKYDNISGSLSEMFYTCTGPWTPMCTDDVCCNAIKCGWEIGGLVPNMFGCGLVALGKAICCCGSSH